MPALASIALKHVDRLERDGVERGPRDVRAAGAPRHAEQRAARIRIPVGRPQTGERGHQRHAFAAGALRGERLDLVRGVDDAEAVPQPLNGRAA